jgi:predicted kinase
MSMPAPTPTVHLLHGFLGAGKTTLARQLERQLPAVRYTPDEWMSRLFGDDPPAEHFQRHLDAVFELMTAHWPMVIQCGVDVVLDYGFWSRAARDAARRRAAELGCNTRLYALHCSEPTARRRCRERNEQLAGSLLITDPTFDTLKARFEPLAPDEPHTRIDSE